MSIRAARLRKIHDALFVAYGPQHWWPAHSRSETSFEVIVGAYLTQNTSWKAVERSLDALRSAVTDRTRTTTERTW